MDYGSVAYSCQKTGYLYSGREGLILEGSHIDVKKGGGYILVGGALVTAWARFTHQQVHIRKLRTPRNEISLYGPVGYPGC